MYTTRQREPALPPEIAVKHLSSYSVSHPGEAELYKNCHFLGVFGTELMSWPSFAVTVPHCPTCSSCSDVRTSNPYRPPGNSIYTSTWGVSSGTWGLFITSLYWAAMATRVMALTVWRWKGACGQRPQRVHGPSFLCSDCFGLARLPTQTDGAVISDFIVEWVISYKLVFIAPWQHWRDPSVECWSWGGGVQVS